MHLCQAGKRGKKESQSTAAWKGPSRLILLESQPPPALLTSSSPALTNPATEELAIVSSLLLPGSLWAAAWQHHGMATLPEGCSGSQEPLRGLPKGCCGCLQETQEALPPPPPSPGKNRDLA